MGGQRDSQQEDVLDGAEAPEVSSHARTLAKLVRGKNIHEETLLATDYLNHFNEVIMLIGMIPDMPECLEDAKAWQPKSYEAHFRDSAFVDKDLAILAYENAPLRFREPFDNTITQMNYMVEVGLAHIEEVVAEGHPDKLADVIKNISRKLQLFVDTASAIIHGAHRAMDQAEIDSMLGK